MYFADSLQDLIWEYDYAEQATGRRVLLDLREHGSGPDGATVDAEGYIWLTLALSGRLYEYLRRVGSIVSLNYRCPTLPVPLSAAAIWTCCSLHLSWISVTANRPSTRMPAAWL